MKKPKKQKQQRKVSFFTPLEQMSPPFEGDPRACCFNEQERRSALLDRYTALLSDALDYRLAHQTPWDKAKEWVWDHAWTLVVCAFVFTWFLIALNV